MGTSKTGTSLRMDSEVLLLHIMTELGRRLSVSGNSYPHQFDTIWAPAGYHKLPAEREQHFLMKITPFPNSPVSYEN